MTLSAAIDATCLCVVCNAPASKGCPCHGPDGMDARLLRIVADCEPLGIAEDQILDRLYRMTPTAPGKPDDRLYALVLQGKLAWRGLRDEDAPLVYRIPHPVKLRGRALSQAVEQKIGEVGRAGYAACDLHLFFGVTVAGALKRLEGQGKIHWAAHDMYVTTRWHREAQHS